MALLRPMYHFAQQPSETENAIFSPRLCLQIGKRHLALRFIRIPRDRPQSLLCTFPVLPPGQIILFVRADYPTGCIIIKMNTLNAGKCLLKSKRTHAWRPDSRRHEKPRNQAAQAA